MSGESQDTGAHGGFDQDAEVVHFSHMEEEQKTILKQSTSLQGDALDQEARHQALIIFNTVTFQSNVRSALGEKIRDDEVGGVYEIRNGELYAEGYGTLSTILERAKDYAEKTKKPHLYNPEEARALKEVERIIVSGEAPAVAYSMYHEAGTRYIPVMERSGDSVVVRSVDVGKWTRRDLSSSEGADVIKMLHEKHRDNTQLSESSQSFPIIALNSRLSTREIQQTALSRSLVSGYDATKKNVSLFPQKGHSSPDDFSHTERGYDSSEIRDLTGVRSFDRVTHDAAVAVQQVKDYLAKKNEKKKIQGENSVPVLEIAPQADASGLPPNSEIAPTEKKGEKKEIKPDAHPPELSGSPVVVFERKKEPHGVQEGPVQTRKEQSDRSHRQVVGLLIGTEVGVIGGSLGLLALVAKEPVQTETSELEKTDGLGVKQHAEIVGEQQVQNKAVLPTLREPGVGERPLIGAEPKQNDVNVERQGKPETKRVRKIERTLKGLVASTEKAEAKPSEEKKEIQMSALSLLATLIRDFGPNKKTKQDERGLRQIHVGKKISEEVEVSRKKLSFEQPILRWAFAGILYHLLTDQKRVQSEIFSDISVPGELPIQVTKTEASKPEGNDEEASIGTQWLLLSIIWYLSMIREQGIAQTPQSVVSSLQKKSKKKTQKIRNKKLAPTGHSDRVIFSFSS